MVNIDPVLYIGISQSFFAGLLILTKKPLTKNLFLTIPWTNETRYGFKLRVADE